MESTDLAEIIFTISLLVTMNPGLPSPGKNSTHQTRSLSPCSLPAWRVSKVSSDSWPQVFWYPTKSGRMLLVCLSLLQDHMYVHVLAFFMRKLISTASKVQLRWIRIPCQWSALGVCWWGCRSHPLYYPARLKFQHVKSSWQYEEMNQWQQISLNEPQRMLMSELCLTTNLVNTYRGVMIASGFIYDKIADSLRHLNLHSKIYWRFSFTKS